MTYVCPFVVLYCLDSFVPTMNREGWGSTRHLRNIFFDKLNQVVFLYRIIVLSIKSSKLGKWPCGVGNTIYGNHVTVG